MSMPIGPGPQVVGQGPGPVPASGQQNPVPPPDLVLPIAQATGVGPVLVAAFLLFVADRNPQALERVINQPPQQLAQLIREFAQSPAAQEYIQRIHAAPEPAPRTQPPPGDMPGQLPPGPGGPRVESGPPPGGLPPPPPEAGGPPPMPPGGPMPVPGQARPPRAPKPKPAGPKKPKRSAPPQWSPPELPKARYPKGPDRMTVLRHAEEGKKYFADLTTALESWRRIYHGTEDDTKLDGLPNNPWKGEQAVTRAQPTLMASRVVGLTAPTLERLGLNMSPWSDDDESREAATEVKNFARSMLEEIYRRSERSATHGVFTPPFPRHLAGLGTIEGGCAVRIMPNPEAEGLPWDVELVPMYEIFARPVATTRQIECTLGEAYAYPEMEKLFPREELSEKVPLYTEDTRIKLVVWTDETHWCMTCDGVDGGLTKKVVDKQGEADWWIQPPTEHKLGRRIYLVPNPWDATPLGPSTMESDRAKHLSRGIYAALAPQITLVNQLVGALRAGAFKALKPALKWKLNPAMRATYPDLFPKITQQMYDRATVAGGHAVLGPDEDVGVIDQSFSGSPDGQALMAQASADMGDAAPPVLGGRGAAQSGFDRFQANEAAGVLHVDPVIAWNVGVLEFIVETILTDFARLGQGKDQLWTKLPYRVYQQRGKVKGGGFVAELTAKDILRVGPYVKVVFKRLGLTERMQLAQLHQLLVHDHFESRLAAMEEMGIEDTEREQARMLLEVALENPAVVKAAMLTALRREAAQEPQEGEDGDLMWARIFLDAVEEELAKEQLQQQPQQPGLPSPAAPPGPPPGPPPPMPGATQMPVTSAPGRM